jgi:hypothetical protein
MLPLVIAVVLALSIPAVMGGSYTRLLSTAWPWGSFLGAGMGIQILLELGVVPEERWHDLGFGLLVASYVFILAFCGRNLLHTGMSIVMIGIACNAVAIAVNQGMAVDAPEEWIRDGSVTDTVKHHVQTDDDELMFLNDIIVLDSPWDTVLSFGDLIIVVGLCDVTYHASRRPRRRGSPRVDGSVATGEARALVPALAMPSPEIPAPATSGVPSTSGSNGNEVRGHDTLERVEHPRVVHVPRS